MSKGSIVLIACGSFSPPTYMHLRMFEIARDYIHSFGIGSVVGGIVSPVHDAYGKKDLVASHHRISMLKLALRSSNWIKVSEWESRQAGWTRTRLSLKYHQDIINGYKSNLDPDSAEWLPDDVLNVNSYDETDNFPLMTNGNYQERVTVKLLCGADLLESFATPGLWSDEDIEAIVGTHGLVVVTRAGSNPSKFIHESDILYKHRRNILLVPNHVVNEVSSTVVRRLLRRGESARYLTDDAVLAYAARHALYAAAPEHASLRDVTSSTARPPPGRRAKKTNFLISSSRTDSVSPVDGVKPKLAYVDRVPPGYVPGKAVKIVSDVAQHATAGDKVSPHPCGGDPPARPPSPPRGSSRRRCAADVKTSRSEASKLCDKASAGQGLGGAVRGPGVGARGSRSCEDIVRLLLTKHGIHVLSDSEAVV